MRKMDFLLLFLILTGCSATSSTNTLSPSAANITYTSVMPSKTVSGVDVDAINAAIKANDQYYLGPSDDVFQQAMDDDLTA